MSQTFVVNGKTYNSPDEMPPDVRTQFESLSNVFADKDQNGLPDMMESMMGANATLATTGTTVMQTSTIVFDGKTYASVDDLPPEGRAAYEKAMGKLADENHDGVPDLMENALKNAPTIVSTQFSAGTPGPTSQPSSSSNMGPIIVLSIVILGLLVIVGLLLVLVLNKTGR